MDHSRWFALSLVWVAGVATILGSRLQDEKPPGPPPVPVTVEFELTGDLERKLEARTDDISDLSLTGSYSDRNQGDKLTLDRNSIVLGDDSGFTIQIEEDAADLAKSCIDVVEDFDVAMTRGRFSSLLVTDVDEPCEGGTTTTVTVTPAGIDVETTGGSSVRYDDLSVFEAAEHEENEALDVRMASAAYNVFNSIVTTARLVEDLIDLIEDNKTTIEGMNTNTELSLPCDNATTDGADVKLTWVIDDSSGSGQGEIGAGDELRAEYSNCEDEDFDLFLQGEVTLDHYDPAGSGTLAVEADMDVLFLSDAPIDVSPTPAPDSPRWDGKLTVSFAEQAVTR